MCSYHLYFLVYYTEIIFMEISYVVQESSMDVVEISINVIIFLYIIFNKHYIHNDIVIVTIKFLVVFGFFFSLFCC